MSIENRCPPDGPRPTPVPVAQRWEIMERVRSYFRTWPKFHELTERFNVLLEHQERSANRGAGGPFETGKDPAATAASSLTLDGAATPGEHDFHHREVVAEDVRAGMVEVDGPVKHPEGLIIVLTGETGSGKSEALNRLFWLNRDRLDGHLISLLAPNPCTMEKLGRDLLSILGYPIVRSKKPDLLWEDVQRRLNDRKGTVIYIDEFQHLTQRANIDQQQNILNTIKALVQSRENPVHLILSGTCVLADFLRTDRQVARRCKFVEFERLDIAIDALPIACTIEELVELSPLEIDESVANEVAPRLIHAVNYAFGLAIEVACDAIEVALRVGDATLTRSHFEKALYDRISCPRARNPFVVDNWSEIDPTLILNRKTTEVELVTQKKRLRDSRNRNARS